MRKFKILIALLFVTMYATEAFGAVESGLLTHPTTVGLEVQEPWTGVDVSIVGRYATSFGRPPREPYINTDRGDLLLSLFTLGGVIGGFIIGYNWHKLMKSH